MRGKALDHIKKEDGAMKSLQWYQMRSTHKQQLKQQHTKALKKQEHEMEHEYWPYYDEERSTRARHETTVEELSSKVDTVYQETKHVEAKLAHVHAMAAHKHHDHGKHHESALDAKLGGGDDGVSVGKSEGDSMSVSSYASSEWGGTKPKVEEKPEKEEEEEVEESEPIDWGARELSRCQNDPRVVTSSFFCFDSIFGVLLPLGRTHMMATCRCGNA